LNDKNLIIFVWYIYFVLLWHCCALAIRMRVLLAMEIVKTRLKNKNNKFIANNLGVYIENYIFEDDMHAWRTSAQALLVPAWRNLCQCYKTNFARRYSECIDRNKLKSSVSQKLNVPQVEPRYMHKLSRHLQGRLE